MLFVGLLLDIEEEMKSCLGQLEVGEECPFRSTRESKEEA